MKLGIITFHFGCNFGGFLQCMALQNVLKAQGHDVEVVDYHPEISRPWPFYRGWNPFMEKRMERFKNRWFSLYYGARRRKIFDQAREDNISLSPFCHSAEETFNVVKDYDALVVGSDQIWNRSYTTSPVYYLDFCKEFLGKKFSYAACCGHHDMPSGGLEQVRSALLQFDAISVRNQVTYEWVNRLTGVSPAIVCDPTLLYDFSSFATPPHRPLGKYVVAYVLGNEIDGGHSAAIKQIKKRVGNIPVVAIAPAQSVTEVYPWADYVVRACGPSEWVGWIANSGFVYTDSFHGVIFALKYGKRFFAYYKESIRAQRLLDVAERYGVVAAISASVEDALASGCFDAVLDYTQINKKIAEHIAISQQFLSSIR